MMKKILITGFSGFVSRHFIEYLENNQISAMIKGIDLYNPEFGREKFKYVISLLSKLVVKNISAC